MHQCLRIQEVMVNVFDYIFYDDIKSLARLARTCKMFLNPALDILWSSQPSLVALLECFPRDVIDDRRHGARVALKRIPKLKDFERVQFYASRIRSLKHSQPFSGICDIDIVSCSLLLTQRLHLGPLLPNLTHLIISLDDFCDQSVYARLVMSPNLRFIRLKGQMTLETEEAEEAWKNVIAILAPCLPLLHEFQFWADLHNSRPGEYYSLPPEILCGSFRNIETLKIPLLNLSPEVLTLLAKLPALEELEFVMLSDCFLSFNNTSPLPGDFDRIQSLVIHTDEIRGCARFLSRPTFRHLLHLTIVDEGFGPIRDFGSLTKDMETPRLQSFKLLRDPDYPFTRIEDISTISFTRSTLNSLLRIKSIIHLESTFDLALHLINEDLENISTAWPRLRYLSLPDNRLEIKPKLTFEGLFPLIKNCQDLKTLIIRVDATTIPKFYSSGGLKPSHQLTHLGLCTSPLPHWQRTNVLEIVPLLFPCLETLDVSEIYRLANRLDQPIPPEEKMYRDTWLAVISGLRPLVPSHDVDFPEC